ncbi:MAG: urease accessory protein UreE [Pseudomonadota bacterium]|nr:urease accessory protein UreE [Pseudomonadota bacterium]
MLEISERLAKTAKADTTLTLPFDLRRKTRLRVRLDSGEEAALFLPRGTVLRQGDLLQAATGLVVRVEAAQEQVSTAFADSPRLLARACYHLGNRHVSLEIGDGWLRYLHDHVLDAMVQGLGLTVVSESTAFEPEAGVNGSGHGHAHPH